MSAHPPWRNPGPSDVLSVLLAWGHPVMDWLPHPMLQSEVSTGFQRPPRPAPSEDGLLQHVEGRSASPERLRPFGTDTKVFKLHTQTLASVPRLTGCDCTRLQATPSGSSQGQSEQHSLSEN